MGERFSFDTDLLLGRNFMQLGPGILGLPALLLGFDWSFGNGEEDNSFGEFLIMGIAAILSAEHFSYHIPLKNTTDLSPYVSLLRLRSFGTEDNSGNEIGAPARLCFGAGLELNKYFGRFLISPYVDYTVGYAAPIHGITCGVNLGYYIPARR